MNIEDAMYDVIKEFEAGIRDGVYVLVDTDMNHPLTFPVLALAGESGEVANKWKKILRDKGGEISEEDKMDMADELGDVLWYLTATASVLGFSLAEIIEMNQEKLRQRYGQAKLSERGA